MALERCTQTPQFLDTAGGHERLGAMMDARQGIPGVRVNPDKSADSPPAGPAGVGLGKTAKSVDQDSQNAISVIANSPAWKAANADRQARRTQKLNHQRTAAKLLPGSRTANCLWAVASNAAGVDVIHNMDDARSRFSGLQTCGSVWACPCCSHTISDSRRQELNDLLAWARSQGYVPVLMSLTARHTKAHKLPDLLNSLKNAKKRLCQRREWRALPLIGSVTATEVTGGGTHGWHPHFHTLMLIEATTEAEAIEFVERLRAPWLSCLRAFGLDGAGAAFDVQGAASAGNYVGKWGAAEELALGERKKGRHGRTPFQLLHDASETGDTLASELFVEYAKTFKGRRQLVWSRGLKELAGIKERSDERLAEDEVRRAEAEANEMVMGTFDKAEWKTIRPSRAQILQAAEHGPAELGRFVKRLWGMGGTPMSTPDEAVPPASPPCNPQGSQDTKV